MTPEHLAELEAKACDPNRISIQLAPKTLQELLSTIADLEQRLAESYQAHRELGELFREAKEALQKLHDYQNGCPLEKI